MYYPRSGNKSADHCTADMRLCFCICMLLIYKCSGSASKLVKILTFTGLDFAVNFAILDIGWLDWD